MYKYWKLDNIKTQTTNNNGDVFVYFLQFEFLNGELGDDIAKVTVESGDKSSILTESSGALISPSNKRDIWYYIYELDTPSMLSKVFYKNLNEWGQAWQTADLSFSLDGVVWTFYERLTTPNLNTNSELKTRVFNVPQKTIDYFKIVSEVSFPYWRISEIHNRRSDQTYRSVGNLTFKTKTGEVSDNPLYGFSESHPSLETSPGNAFDGLNTTYTVSASLEDGTNTEEHGLSWWIGYKFPKTVEIDSIDVSMRFDMAKEDYKYSEDYLGQEWKSFQLEGSEDGLVWKPVRYCHSPKIFKNDTSVHTYREESARKISARYWKVSEIIPLDGDYVASASRLELNTETAEPVLNISCATYGSNYTPDSVWRLLDKNPHTTWRNNSLKGEFIVFEYKEPVVVTSVDLQMRQDMESSWQEEWQTADISFSSDGTYWVKYGSISPNIPNMDLTLKKEIPITKVITSSFIEYVLDLTSNKYKFWRCSNINTLPSLTNYSFDITGSILKFINTENVDLLDTGNTFAQSFETKEVGLGVPSNGFDNNPNTWFHSKYPESQSAILKNYENYFIGCMFEEPVEVTKIGYKPRPNLSIDWGQTWQSCNVEFSPNGFDWFQKGYCDFNIKRLSPAYVEREVLSAEVLEKHRFWRVGEVFTKNTGVAPHWFDGWELRFNTLTGGQSNEPSRGFSTNAWGSSWMSGNAFDGNVLTNAGGFHPKEANSDKYSIGYEFDAPQHVYSISVLMRRDHNNSSWIYATVEASDDGIDWTTKGYANLNIESNTRFYTARLDSVKLTDMLEASALNTKVVGVDIYNSTMDGIFKGQVLEMNEPIVREVALYERRTRKLVAITWSDVEGNYEFNNLDIKKTYYVHAVDSNKIYNAVTKDMVEPLKQGLK